MGEYVGESPWSDIDSARARVQQQIAQAQQTAARAQQAQAQIAQLRGKAKSREGDIEASCDASGTLVALTLTDDALSRTAPALAAAIVATAGAARKDAGQRAIAVAEATMGADAPGIAMMRAEMARRDEADATRGLQ